MATQDFTKVDPATLTKAELEAMDDDDFAALKERQREQVQITTEAKYQRLNELLQQKKRMTSDLVTVNAQLALLFTDLGK